MAWSEKLITRLHDIRTVPDCLLITAQRVKQVAAQHDRPRPSPNQAHSITKERSVQVPFKIGVAPLESNSATVISMPLTLELGMTGSRVRAYDTISKVIEPVHRPEVAVKPGLSELLQMIRDHLGEPTMPGRQGCPPSVGSLLAAHGNYRFDGQRRDGRIVAD
jgi:hypothetical protein